MNQKRQFSIFSLGFVSLLVFALVFSACNNSTSPKNPNPVDPEAQTPVAEDFIFENLTQTAGKVVAISITPKPGKSGGKITIYYDKLTTLPSDVGEYPVTFNVAKASGWNAVKGLSAGTLTINATDQEPLAEDFEFGNLTQTAGSVIPVSITPLSGKSAGTITIYYDGSTTLPTEVGTYTVTFDVAAAVGFNAAVGLSAGTLTIENQTPVVEDYTAGNLTQTAGAIIPVSITPKPGKSGGAITAIYYAGSTEIPTETGTYLVTFDVAAVDGFNAVAGLVAGTLTINATDQDPVAGDFDTGNLTQTEGSVTPVSITPLSGKSAGAITIYYNGSATLPTAVGTYTVTFDVAAATGFKAAVGLAAGTLTINAAVVSNVKYKIYSNGVLNSNYELNDWSAVKTTNLESTEGGGHSGDKAIKLPNTGDRYLSIRAKNANPVNWSTVDALSFWVKGDNIRVSAFGFLDDAVSGNDTLNVEYKGEDGTGIMAGNTWQQVLIPLPAVSAKSTAVSRREVFKLWITGQDNKALYIDDIELVSTSKNFAIVIPSATSASAGTTVSIASLLGNYKAEYTVDGKKVSLFSNTVKFANWFDITYNVTSGATRNGDNITATGNFTMTVAFGGNTSNTLSVTVTGAPPAPPPASNVKYKIYSDGTLTSGYTINDWGSGTVQTASTAGGGHSGTRAMRLPDGVSWGRGLSIRAANANTIDWSTVDALSFWVKGDNVRVSSFGLLDDAGSGNDTMNLEYKGENEQGITLNNTWQQILIPLPAGNAKGAAISRSEVFKIYLTNDQNNKAVYIDDVELISATKSLRSIILPGTANISAGTVSIASLVGNYKTEFTVDNKTVSLFNNTVRFANWFNNIYSASGASISGDNITASGNFSLTAAFGGRTSNQLSVTVTGTGGDNDQRFTGVRSYSTSNNSRFAQGTTYNFANGNGSNSIKIAVNEGQNRGSIAGFGGSLTHGSAYIIYNSPNRDATIDALFNPETGANFSVVRLAVGSSDFPTYVGSTYNANGQQTSRGTLKYHSLCDTQGPEGNLLRDFSIAVDKQEVIPVIKLIQAKNPRVKFLGSPWSAPPWMKGSYSPGENGMLGGQLRTDMEDTYAQYLVKFVQAYAAEGITIDYLTIQNEPAFGSSVTPTMWMSAAQEARMVGKLSAALSTAGLSTKIVVHDHNTDMWSSRVDALLGDTNARNAYGVGMHGYAPNSPVSTFANNVKGKYPNIRLFFTEMTEGSSSNNFDGDLNWAVSNMIMPSAVAGSEAILYFNFALDQNGMPFIRPDWTNYHCDGLIELNSNGQMYYQSAFFGLKHFAAFSRNINGTAANWIGCSSTNGNVTVAASKQANGKIAVNVFSSSSQNVAIQYNGKAFDVTVPGNRLTTFVWFGD